MTMDYLACGKLEGLLLSISPWTGRDDNRHWTGSRPERAVVSVEEDGGGEMWTAEVAEGVAEEAVMVSDDTIFDTRYMCDPPTMAASSVRSESKQSSKYVVVPTVE